MIIINLAIKHFFKIIAKFRKKLTELKNMSINFVLT